MVSSSEQPTLRNDAYWRDYLGSGDSRERSLRRVLKLIPGEPRCRLCAGRQHAARAVETARAILVATGHEDPGVPWAPAGAGIQAGVAWVGAVGSGARIELTALGDAVNTAARLASAAATGEILVSESTANAAGLGAGLAHRQLELKGKSAPTDVVVLQVGAR